MKMIILCILVLFTTEMIICECCIFMHLKVNNIGCISNWKSVYQPYFVSTCPWNFRVIVTGTSSIWYFNEKLIGWTEVISFFDSRWVWKMYWYHWPCSLCAQYTCKSDDKYNWLILVSRFELRRIYFWHGSQHWSILTLLFLEDPTK